MKEAAGRKVPLAGHVFETAVLDGSHARKVWEPLSYNIVKVNPPAFISFTLLYKKNNNTKGFPIC